MNDPFCPISTNILNLEIIAVSRVLVVWRQIAVLFVLFVVTHHDSAIAKILGDLRQKLN